MYLEVDHAKHVRWLVASRRPRPHGLVPVLAMRHGQQYWIATGDLRVTA